ncbi:MAG: hypothetical protein U1E17_13145 [Geminicoccaceae bacterium]
MSTPEPGDGWAWFQPQAPAREPADAPARHALVCLGTPAGRALLDHLRHSFLDRRIPPTASDAELWHAEGQRSVVHHLLLLLERGRGEPAPAARPTSPGASA